MTAHLSSYVFVIVISPGPGSADQLFPTGTPAASEQEQACRPSY